MKKEATIKDKTLATYEHLLRMPAAQSEELMHRCNQCQKVFMEKSFLEQHYKRRHPEVNFLVDYKPPVKTQQHGAKPAQVEVPQKLDQKMIQ